ncbi:hypothetical protein LTR97_001235 [Elasticomyces elasticus]|uniref:Uncharacterized protein n=1 Tax=Elasticomyces elasticus TaxID=574655 RepID=A0AAN7WBQ9_9PEZI|nr:hypothetical protein LTR97_001235 [Elasticomyces elasticus]
MGRGGPCYLSYTALVLLSTPSSANALCAFCDLWKVSIWQGPAPAPEDGPPFSAHATRNKDVLPYEIVGIVLSYVVTVIILGILLLTVGRRLRKRAQEMATRPTELVKPMRRQFDPSPISPRSARSWYTRKLRNKKSATSSIRSGHSNIGSPGMDSVVSFDANVVEADRARRQEEMERLYAAVMAHDDRKSQGEETTIVEVPPDYSQKRPPRIMTDNPRLKHLQAPEMSPRSPGTPKSPIRAIYPPDSPVPSMPQSPGSPIRAEYPAMPSSPQYNQSGELRENRKDRSSSLGSKSTIASETMSTGKKIRKSLRNIKISAPLQDDNSDGARTPLSPRFYTDPGIPPEPPTARTTETTDSRNAPTTPGTAKSWRYPDEDEVEQLDEVRALPQAHPNRLSTFNYHNEAQAITDAASIRRDPTNPDGSTKTQLTAPTTASNASRPLPFRQLNTALPSPQTKPQQQQFFPLSPMNFHNARQNPVSPHYPFSAGPGQTQFVSPRRDKFGGPRTGLATPYSPYMPFTPLTPVTPHLTSRAERKQRAKEERGLRGVVTEEEMVVEEGELWSSGY